MPGIRESHTPGIRAQGTSTKTMKVFDGNWVPTKLTAKCVPTNLVHCLPLKVAINATLVEVGGNIS